VLAFLLLICLVIKGKREYRAEFEKKNEI
jgi:hypothetical protein